MAWHLPEEFSHTCLQTLWNTSSDCVFVLSVGGEDFCYQALNDACARLLQTEPNALVGQPLKKWYSPAVYELIATPFKRCARANKPITYEQMFDNEAGGYTEWETTLTPVVGQTGRVSYLFGQSRNITMQKQMQRSITQLRRETDNAKKIKSSFLANISHEMRTPVNGLLGAVDVLLNTEDESEKRHFADILRASADGLAQLTDDIFDYAKLNTASMALQHERFSLFEVLQDIALEKQSVLVRHADLLTMHLEPIRQSYFYGDARRVRQMLTILIDNAIKFTREGKVSINAELSSEGADYQVIDLKIRDTGCGIALDDLSEVFKPFKQIDESSTRKHGGLGLGLSICQQLALLMAGDVSVSSIPGQGSEFVLRIPLTMDVESTSKDIAETTATDLAVLKGARVLVVDDNAVNRMIAERLLKGHGLDVASAVNGKEALAYCEKETVDIVIMDWHMPEMDGLEATSKIRQLKDCKASVPIIGLTANVQLQESALYGDAGMNDVLTKPINTELLMNKLAHWLAVSH